MVENDMIVGMLSASVHMILTTLGNAIFQKGITDLDTLIGVPDRCLSLRAGIVCISMQCVNAKCENVRLSTVWKRNF